MTSLSADGRALRQTVPRAVHGEWQAATGRQDPVEILRLQAANRLPELIPIRYGRMLISPLAYFRGAAAVMASDLAALPQTDLSVQLCGDAHLSNFGAYAGPDRRLVFSVNDFDETLPGPFEWDLKRLVTSFAITARERGLPAKGRDHICQEVTRSYREAMHRLARLRAVDLWYTSADPDLETTIREWSRSIDRKQRKRHERDLAKARAKDNLRALTKLTEIIDGRPRIINDPPLIVRLDHLPGSQDHDLADLVARVLDSYRATLPCDRQVLLSRYEYVDAARKVVGVGSVGTRAMIALLLGDGEADPLFLQIKEAQPSVLEARLGASEFAHHGRRVVEGQRLMQATSDIMLGWLTTTWTDGTARDFYVRQLWDQKGSVSVELMDSHTLAAYGRLCARALARSHARSGRPQAIAAYLGTGRAFDRAIARFSELYADQNERDFERLQSAAASNEVEVATGL